MPLRLRQKVQELLLELKQVKHPRRTLTLRRHYDFLASPDEAEAEYAIRLIPGTSAGKYDDAIVVAVGHRQFREMDPAKVRSFGKPQRVVYDLKYVFAVGEADLCL